ncbi:MAG: response regulator transcription factor [Candidatus Marinimicrobia bacterium]|nr:response regulator transcription factor [Candidatus Neomarinimicrobiota bacterium]
MSKNILVVDDEEDIRKLISLNLIKNNYNVFEAENGVEALKIVANKDIDMILLDVMMPEKDGYDVCKDLRKNNNNVPIIFLTAKDSEFDEVLGLELGADDYVKKPFSMKSLMSRIKTIFRRTDEPSYEKDKINVYNIEINKTDYTVKIDGMNVFFPRKEFEILAFLCSHPNKVFPREFLLSRIWQDDTYVVDRTIDVHIGRIRKKLGNHSDYLKTVVGVGYKFILE